MRYKDDDKEIDRTRVKEPTKNMSSPRKEDALSSQGGDSSSRSRDTFEIGEEPLNVTSMMEKRRRSRATRPRQFLTALRSSLNESLRHNSGSSQEDNNDVGNKNNNGKMQSSLSARSLFRKDSSASGGSDSDAGGGRDSQLTHRRSRKDLKSSTTFRLPHFLSHASPSQSHDDSTLRQLSIDRGNDDSEKSRYAKSIRRYAVGNYVLISNHGLAEEANCLVNRYGYPEVGGGALTPEQRRGPYIYLVAQVKSVHFEEDAQYYTVARGDNDVEQRADAGWMEPITDLAGIEAARTAARKKFSGASSHVQSHSDRRIVESLAYCTMRCINMIRGGTSLIHRKMKEQATKFLNGSRPYKISFKFTGVNFLVVCSIWYLYIDQLRLAFFPHTVDTACAVVSW